MSTETQKYYFLPVDSNRYAVNRSFGSSYVRHYYNRRNGWKKSSIKKFSKDDQCKFFPLDSKFLRRLSIEDRKAFSFVLKIKTRFENSRVYNYTPQRLSLEIGVSEYMTKKIVNKLVKIGFAKFNTSGDLILASLDNMIHAVRSRHCGITVYKNDSLQDIVDKLSLITLECHIKNQDFAKYIKSNDQKRKDLISNEKRVPKHLVEEQKQFGKRYENLLRGDLVEANYLGMRKLGKILNCSTDSAWKFLCRQKQMGTLTAKPDLREICHNFDSRFFFPEEIKQELGKKAGYLYVAHDILYAHLGTIIELNSDKIKDKRYSFNKSII